MAENSSEILIESRRGIRKGEIKMRIKKILCLILALAAAYSFAGFRYVTYDYAFDQPGTKQGNITLQYSMNGTDMISSEYELNEFLSEMLISGKDSVPFKMSQSVRLDMDQLAARFAIPYLDIVYVEQDGIRTASAMFTNFPGNRLLYAYYNNDTSILSSDELRVYQWARQFVANNIRSDMSDTEKELIILEQIAQKVNYYTAPTESSSNLYRFQTIIGAILDGQANCMGYTDTFTVLAAFSGLEVTRQTGYLNGESHLWNLVRIGDSWYAADATNFDACGENRYMSMDETDLWSLGYNWNAANALHDIG